MVGCASSPQHTTTGKTSPSGKRIFIPQERVIIERPIPPKVEPASYRAWLNTGDHYAINFLSIAILILTPFVTCSNTLQRLSSSITSEISIFL